MRASHNPSIGIPSSLLHDFAKWLSLLYDFAKWLFDILNTWVSLVSGLIFVILLVLTQSHGEPRLGTEYIDDMATMLVQQFDVRLRFVWNPLSRLSGGFGVFDYNEGAACEVAGLEFGYLPTILSSSAYKEETKEGHCHIKFSEKSLLREKKISILKITLTYKYDKPDYRDSIHPSFVSGKLQVTNDNVHIVKRYAVRVPRISNKDNLKHDPKVYDWYDEGSETVIIFKEIPARISSIVGQEIIWV